MTELKPLKPEKLLKIVKKLGYGLIHVKISHYIFKNAEGKRIAIPVHKGKPIGKGLLLKIIKEDLQLTREEFQKMV